MKQLITTLLITLSTTLTFAQQDPAPAASLGSVMKAMQSDLKQVVAQVNDASKNAASEKLALDFVKQTTLAKNYTPDTIKSLPASQQPAKKDEYNKMLDDTIQLGNDLAAAFHNNDNANAQSILAKLSQAKKDGHAEFK